MPQGRLQLGGTRGQPVDQGTATSVINAAQRLRVVMDFGSVEGLSMFGCCDGLRILARYHWGLPQDVSIEMSCDIVPTGPD